MVVQNPTKLIPSANVVCEGYVFTGVCHSVHRGGGACVVAPGGNAWLLWGACVVARRACVVVPGGVHGCSWGACMVALGGHAWLLWGGMRGCSGGVCMVTLGGMHGCS